MMTYRCAGCAQNVKVEEIYITGGDNVIEISPCEVCVDAAEEAVREEAYDKGYQEGWQAGYDTADEEWQEMEDKKEEEKEYGEDNTANKKEGEL